MQKTAFLLTVVLLFVACGKEGESGGGSETSEISSDVFPYTKNGQILYYRIVGDHAEVTHPIPSWEGYLQPEGDIVIPETITYQGKSYTVNSIGDSAFYECCPTGKPGPQVGDGLERRYISVSMPLSIKYVGDWCMYFRGDSVSYLCSVKCKPTIPPVIDSCTFICMCPGWYDAVGNWVNGATHCSVYVPCETLEDYKSAPIWSAINNHLRCDENN